MIGLVRILKTLVGKDDETKIVRQASRELLHRSSRIVESTQSKSSYAHLLVEQIRKETKR